MGVYLDNKETTVYNLPFFLPLDSDIDIERLKETVRKLFEYRPHLFMRVNVDEEATSSNISKDAR